MLVYSGTGTLAPCDHSCFSSFSEVWVVGHVLYLLYMYSTTKTPRQMPLFCCTSSMCNSSRIKVLGMT